MRPAHFRRVQPDSRTTIIARRLCQTVPGGTITVPGGRTRRVRREARTCDGRDGARARCPAARRGPRSSGVILRACRSEHAVRACRSLTVEAYACACAHHARARTRARTHGHTDTHPTRKVLRSWRKLCALLRPTSATEPRHTRSMPGGAARLHAICTCACVQCTRFGAGLDAGNLRPALE